MPCPLFCIPSLQKAAKAPYTLSRRLRGLIRFLLLVSSRLKGVLEREQVLSKMVLTLTPSS